MEFASSIPAFGLFYLDKHSIEAFNSTFNLNKNSFFYCKRGSVRFTHKGKQYMLKSGNIFILPSFSVTYVSEISSDLIGVMGVAEFDFIMSTLQEVTSSKDLMLVRTNPVITMDQAEVENIEELINIIYRRKAYVSSNKLESLLISSLGKALCLELMRIYFSKVNITPAGQERKDSVFQNFLLSLNKNYREQREVSYYAQEQCLSARYFTTVIKKATGESATYWINRLLISKAEQMLKSPDMSIKEISHFMGFPNQSFFGRFFKKHVGVSPLKYRREANIEKKK